MIGGGGLGSAVEFKVLLTPVIPSGEKMVAGESGVGRLDAFLSAWRKGWVPSGSDREERLITCR